MANQNGVITLSGKLDKQVYFRKNGKNFARSAPQHVQLSENSKKSGKEFGRPSSASIRRCWSPDQQLTPKMSKPAKIIYTCFIKPCTSPLLVA
jgi:hypothetical protein